MISDTAVLRLSKNAYAAVAMMNGEQCIDDIRIACETRFSEDQLFPASASS